MRYLIGELARATGETVKTLRYWTNQGLLKAERGENGYRFYVPEAVTRAAFIRATQALGFTLEEIRGILALREEGVQPCEQVREELATHLTVVRARIRELQALEDELTARLSGQNVIPSRNVLKAASISCLHHRLRISFGPEGSADVMA